MFLRLLILIICLTYNLTGTAQSSFSISGIVQDESGNPIQYSSIVILSQPDSTVINSCITDNNGRYYLTIKKAGNYILKSQMVGYHSFCKNIKILNDSICNITLQDDVKVLNEIKVIANRYKYKDDKYTVNIINNPLAQGKSINEIIKYLPGITKLEEVVYINGEIVSDIYIDNRKVVDLVELEAIQASDVLKIEVIPNAGVKLRADDSKGVIKIITKKDKISGYLGNLGVLITCGEKQHSERVTFPFSYKKDNVNIYNYIRINHINEPYLTDINTSYKQIDKIINTSTENRYIGQALSNVFSLVYDINQSQNIGISLNTIQKKNKENIYSSSNVTGEKEYISNYLLYGNRETQQYQSAINYNIEFGEKGSSIHFIGDFLKNNINYKDNRQESYSSYYINDTLYNQTKSTSEQLKIKIDIDICHWENTFLSLGGDIYTNKTSNDIKIFRRFFSESDLLKNLCDDFKYKGEGIGIYSNFEKKFRSTTMGLACRLQRDEFHVNSYNQEINKQTYLNLFPEFSLTYTLNKNIFCKLYAKKGMDAIRYSDMNPIRVYTSDIYYETGNPNLQPVTWFSFGTNTRLGQHLNFNYRYRISKKDVVPMTFIEDREKGITYRMPVNAGNSYSHLININYNKMPLEWWTLNATLQGYITSLRDEEFSKNTKHLFVSISNDFRFSPDSGFEFNFFIERGMQILDTYYHSVYNLDWKFYKYFLNKKIMCSIYGNNLLYKNRILTINNEIYNKCEKNVSRRDFVSISFTWKLNSKEKIKPKRTKEILLMQSTTIGNK